MTSESSGGLFFESPALWIPSQPLSAICAAGLLLICAVGLIFLVRRINFVHTTKVIYSVIMVTGCALFPQVSLRFGAPVLMLAATLVGMSLLLPDFGKPSASHIFLTFSTLAFGATCQFAFLGLILIFVAGCATLQFGTVRHILAGLLGLVAPLWILCGTGVADITTLSLPPFVTIFTPGVVTPGSSYQLIMMGILALLSILLTMSNSTRMFAANANFRASNRFIIIVQFGSIILPVIDILNFTAYIPLLCMALGIQAAHFYTYRICPKY